VAADFEAFDYLIALDGDNHDWLLDGAGEHRHKVFRLGDIPGATDIPDPYYGNLAGFERVRDELHHAMIAVVEQLLQGAQR
jgi:protein-tyrosine phosphatase